MCTFLSQICGRGEWCLSRHPAVDQAAGDKRPVLSSVRDEFSPERKLGNAQDSDAEIVAKLPEAARRLIQSSADLYARIKRIDEGVVEGAAQQSPARALMGRLERGLVGDGSA